MSGGHPNSTTASLQCRALVITSQRPFANVAAWVIHRAPAGHDLADLSFCSMALALWRRAENESAGPFASKTLQCSIINSSAAVISLHSLSLSTTV